jgi:hypothetical protein
MFLPTTSLPLAPDWGFSPLFEWSTRYNKLKAASRLLLTSVHHHLQADS